MISARRYLTQKAEIDLRESIYKMQVRERETREHYGRMVASLVTGTTGLVGAIIGLMAVCAR
jgi:hypothetical protein